DTAATQHDVVQRLLVADFTGNSGRAVIDDEAEIFGAARALDWAAEIHLAAETRCAARSHDLDRRAAILVRVAAVIDELDVARAEQRRGIAMTVVAALDDDIASDRAKRNQSGMADRTEVGCLRIVAIAEDRHRRSAGGGCNQLDITAVAQRAAGRRLSAAAFDKCKRQRGGADNDVAAGAAVTAGGNSASRLESDKTAGRRAADGDAVRGGQRNGAALAAVGRRIRQIRAAAGAAGALIQIDAGARQRDRAAIARCLFGTDDLCAIGLDGARRRGEQARARARGRKRDIRADGNGATGIDGHRATVAHRLVTGAVAANREDVLADVDVARGDDIDRARVAAGVGADE